MEGQVPQAQYETRSCSTCRPLLHGATQRTFEGPHRQTSANSVTKWSGDPSAPHQRSRGRTLKTATSRRCREPRRNRDIRTQALSQRRGAQTDLDAEHPGCRAAPRTARTLMPPIRPHAWVTGIALTSARGTRVAWPFTTIMRNPLDSADLALPMTLYSEPRSPWILVNERLWVFPLMARFRG